MPHQSNSQPHLVPLQEKPHKEAIHKCIVTPPQSSTSDTKPETARDNIFNPYNSCGIDSSNHQPSSKAASNTHCPRMTNEDQQLEKFTKVANFGSNHQLNLNDAASNKNNNLTVSQSLIRKTHFSSNNLDDLEKLDRELSAINAPMPLIDPEITQGAEQLEKAISSRKRLRNEDESDRLVREALSQFYIPPQRLISAIEDCPLDVISVGVSGGVGVGMSNITGKRSKLNSNEMELDFDINQNQKEFEVIMDALRMGSPSPPSTVSSDSCGQAAMMGESASSVFHNLVVTSLET
ncbi:signal transducer and activator of transcription B [Teleopsis dalmanni]|uniref:signal transducer and activator of transcription B n=1 Tax=Teleopsis dalmanni TaxID=139649 RepID=UPI0018CF5E80|nr:signal transducer and activator of transcription B [Teleopsis dalmanni]